MEAARRHKPGRSIKWLVGILLGVAVYFGVASIAILRAASLQELHPASVIVVFGAAEYAGRPSPVFRARLDHAYELYQQKLAPMVIISGGAADDPSFSEGGVGHDYLMQRGIPETSVIAETQASDTAESGARVATIMRENHMKSCIAVSDEYHVFRIRQILEKQGVIVYLAPRPNSRPHSSWQRGIGVLREASSYLLWKLHITG